MKIWPCLVLLLVVGSACVGYVSWLEDRFPRNPEPVCLDPGPVEPIPRVADHVAAVMAHECRDCETQLKHCLAHETQMECPECPTWNALKRAGVEIVCANAFGSVPSVNYWPVEAGMACSRVSKVIVRGGIRVEVRK